MRSMVKFGLAALAFGMATSSQAALVLSGTGTGTTLTTSGGSGGTQVLNFNGFANSVIAGLTSQLSLTFTGAVGNTYTFAYSLLNNSSAPITGSRVSSFGFDVDPNITGASISGAYNIADVGSSNIPNGVGIVDVCFRDGGGNCSGGGNGGVTFGNTGTGSLNLNFTGGLPSSIALSNFYVRYQSVNLPNISGASASGRVVTPPPAVPEPATWAMMMLGFGGIGFALRGRRREGVTTRVRFA